MTRWVAWAFLAYLGTGAFAGCLDDGASLSLDRPLWSSGYSFAYQVSGTSTMQEKHASAEDSGQESDSDTIDPHVYRFEVLNTTLRNRDVPVYVAALANDDAGGRTSVGNLVHAQLVAYRQRDLAFVPVSAATKRQCQNQDCSNSVEIGFGADPDVTYLDFPLQKGKSWSMETKASGDDFFGDESLRWAIRAEVGSPETITTPLGRIRTLPVDLKFSPLDLDEFMREAKESSDDGQIDSLDFHPYRHLKLFYADEYQTVVRSESKGGLDFRISGRDEQGRARTAEGHYDYTQDEVLVGARLVAMPERGEDYIAKVLRGEIALSDPSGMARRAAGYTLSVAVATPVVNAAENPTVAFSAKVVGDASAFAGHSATWRLLDYFGTEIASGTGLEGQQKIGKPGHYVVEFETRDGAGQVTATASSFFVANYEAQVHVNCPIAAFDPVLPGCDAIPVPVRAGIREIKVGARVSGPFQAAHGGQLTLSDGRGRLWTDTTDSQGQYEIVVNDVSSADVGNRDWSLRLFEQPGVSEAVDYTVALSFGAPAAPRAVGQSAPGLGVGVASHPLPRLF